MQNLNSLRKGETVEIGHPKGNWRGVITVIESGRNFKCTVPILTKDTSNSSKFFKAYEKQGWVHLNPQAMWEITSINLEND